MTPDEFVKQKRGRKVIVDGVERKITKVTVEQTDGGFVIRIAVNRRGRPFTAHGETFDDARKAVLKRLRNAA